MAKKPQNVKAEAGEVTVAVTEDAPVGLTARTLAEIKRGREILAERAGAPVPVPEPNLNTIVNLGPVLPLAAKEAAFSKGPAATGIPAG